MDEFVPRERDRAAKEVTRLRKRDVETAVATPQPSIIRTGV